jgi:hypothetical protein
MVPYDASLWLAASLWATTHLRHEVLALLQQAAACYERPGDPWDHFQKLPEFQDVRKDAEFQVAVKKRDDASLQNRRRISEEKP